MGQTILFWVTVIGALAAVGQFTYAALQYHQGVAMLAKGNSKAAKAVRASVSKFPYGRLVLLVVLTWAAVCVDLYNRSLRYGPEWGLLPLTQVRDKKFEGETVPLDGYEYINCEFDNVTFKFEGTAPGRLTNSPIMQTGRGKRMVGLKSDDPVISHVLELVTLLNEATGLKGLPTISMDGKTRFYSPPVIR